MWRNYWLTSIRTFKQNKFYISVNLISIAVAISLCIIGWFNYQYNDKFNEYFPDADRIYKINSQLENGEYAYGMGISTMALASEINNSVTGLEAVRYHAQPSSIKIEDRLFREHTAFVDPSFMNVFRFQNQDGTTIKMMSKSEVLISENTSIRLFGNSNPIGETLLLVQADGKTKSFRVGGVIAKFPVNTSFYFDMIMHIDNYLDIYDLSQTDPTAWINGTFVKVNSGGNLSGFNSMTADFLQRQNTANPELKVKSFRLDPILTWPEYENKLYKSTFRGVLHPASVLGTISSALAILLLACFNFVNTTISISRKRLKEIGVRKVVGGSKKGLVVQFLSESLFQILIALILSGIVSYYLVDLYNGLFNFEIVQFRFVGLAPFITFLFLTWLTIGILSGIYPAFYISRYPSLEIFNNRIKFSNKNKLAKGLLGFQFAVCVYNVFALIVFAQNAEYQEKLDRGYNVDQILNIPLRSANQYDALRSELEQNAKVSAVAGTANVVGYSSSDVNISYEGNDYTVVGLKVGSDYLKTLGVRLIDGNHFKHDESRAQVSVIINSTLARNLDVKSVDEVITVDNNRYTVVGIVEDFNYKPILLNNKIRPLVLFSVPKSEYSSLVIQTSAQTLFSLNKEVEQTWYKLFPDQLYTGFYQKDVMKTLRHTNKIMISINVFIGVISILISALGLYSMIALNVQSRLKEFGIRKVLGASISNIVYLINRDLILILSVSCLIGLTASYFVINNLLDIIYAYHMTIQWQNYAWPVVLIFLISGFTVGLRTWTAARSNPVDHLKME